ncbi:MAG: hypothetical protein IT518_15555 [Burkholderiales bacterium]|nr:hypothetical protein [Burkholderiales bacterium]
MLPVEFARESGVKRGNRGDRITLVICPDSSPVQTYWVLLNVAEIESARMALAKREYDAADRAWADRNVGMWTREGDRAYGMESTTVRTWALKKGLSGAVWTNLSCGFNGERGVMPSGAEVVAFLGSIADSARAEQYVRRAPAQIKTPYRRMIEQALGWLPYDQMAITSRAHNSELRKLVR